MIGKNYSINDGIIIRKEKYGGLIFNPFKELTIRVDIQGFLFLKDIYQQRTSWNETHTLQNKLFLNDLLKIGVLKRGKLIYKKKPRLYENSYQNFKCISFPESLHITITDICNLSCKSCYNSKIKDKDHMTFALATRIIDEAFKEGVLQIAIGGGEPFSHPRIWDILEYLKTREITTNITSNGTLLREKEIKKLESLENIGRLQISLDGTKEIVHRESRSNYEMVIETIGLLKNSKIKYGINFLLRNSNINNLEKMYSFCRKNNAVSLNLLRLKPPIRDKEWFLREKLNKESLKKLKIFLDNKRYRIRPEVYLDASMSYLFQDKDPINLSSNGCQGCSAGVNFLTILPNGDIQPCTHLKWEIGNVDNGIKKLWVNSDCLNILRLKDKYLEEPCSSCNILFHCFGCRALAEEEFNNIWATDRECFLFQNYLKPE